MFAVITWLIIGFFVGLVARWVTGGGGPRGFFLTSLFGSAGAWAGSLIAREYHLPQHGAGGFLMSVIGAIVLLVIVGALARVFRR
jgi:uncharacterized membrane protein YeaQ/YmgE (transglycosylase-associated protein family)